MLSACKKFRFFIYDRIAINQSSAQKVKSARMVLDFFPRTSVSCICLENEKVFPRKFYFLVKLVIKVVL